MGEPARVVDMNRIRRFLALSGREKVVFLRALGWLSFMKLALLVKPFRELRQWVENRSSRKLTASPERVIGRDRIVWSVDVASRYVPKAESCLPRALAAEILLAEYGYASEFKIGVTRGEDGEFMAHAWLEADGEVLIGGTDSPVRYTTLPKIETGS